MPFIIPPNPGHHLAGPIAAAQCAQREAEHKAIIMQFQTCVVKEDSLLEIWGEGIAYLNVTLVQMLTHLWDCWGSIYYVDITALLAECDSPWNAGEVLTKYFN